jgi:hypothetical protein
MADLIAQLRRRLLLPLLAGCCTLALLAATPRADAMTMTGRSNGFVCSPEYNWVRTEWPTIIPNTTKLTAVYFRAFLYRYTGTTWQYYGSTIWYVGVSDKYGRKQLDSSLGVLPYPFVGELGHLFAYVSEGESYADPQLGPWWGELPDGYYSTKEQYSVHGKRWYSRSTHVLGSSETFCAV